MSLLSRAKNTPKNAVGSFTGSRQAEIASKQQDKMMKQALGDYDVYAGDNASKYDSMQRSIVDELSSGKAASVGDYARTTSSPMREMYQNSIQGGMQRSLGGSLGGTASRGVNRTISQGITNADNSMYSLAQDMAGQMKQSALGNLQAAAAGRANIYQGMAAQVTAKPSAAQQAGGLMGAYKNIAGAFTKGGK